MTIVGVLMSKDAEGNAFCDCCGRGPLKQGRDLIDHYEEDAPCSPSIKDFCAECHTDLLGHVLDRAKSGRLESYLKVPVGLLSPPVYNAYYNVLSSCINCCFISRKRLKERIQEICLGEGFGEAEVDSLIRSLELSDELGE